MNAIFLVSLVFLAADGRGRARVRVVRGLHLVVRVHGQPRRELVVVRVADVELEDVDAQVDHLVRDVEHVELVGGAHVVVQHDVGEHLGRARIIFSWFIYNATTTNTSLINAGRDMYFILLSPAIASS